MSKYYGEVGYVDTVEARPGIWKDSVTKKKYQGDVTRNSRRAAQVNDQINDNINASMDISIVADAYAYKNFYKIKYVTYMGTKWKVNNVEVSFPRLILHIGDIYNEEEGGNDTDGK